MNCIYTFQKIINSTINEASVIIPQHTEQNYFATKVNKIIYKYSKQISNIKLPELFKNIEEIYSVKNDNELNYQNIDVKHLIDVSVLNMYNKTGNILLMEFVNGMTDIIEKNKNTSLLIKLLIEIIELLFTLYNNEFIQQNVEMKYFLNKLTSETFVREIEDVLTAVGENDEDEEKDEDDEPLENREEIDMDIKDDDDDMEDEEVYVEEN